jgi:molybdopterin molybdotransferase
VPVRHPGHDLRALLRSGASDADITSALAAVWAGRDDRYSELRACPAVRARRWRAPGRNALHRRLSPMQSLDDIAACVAGYDPNALPVAQAQEFIARLVPRVQAVESLALRSALGRVLARDIVSPIHVPAHDNSAMDGYALRSADLAAGGDTLIGVAGTAFAGEQFRGAVGPGQGVRIMTGAVMPAGLDTVVPQEFTRAGSPTAASAGPARHGAPPATTAAWPAKTWRAAKWRWPPAASCTPADLGLIASLGQAEVPVFRRLRVAFFSTGDELRSIGEPLDEGCVYDSNRYTLWGMLQRLGVDLIDMGVVRDDPAALREAFTQAAASADAVITSGGVSVGEADHTKQVMQTLGEVLFWKIAMRPGRPMAIGRIQRGRVAGHAVRPAGQPGGGDGDLLRLRARRAAGDERCHAAAAAAAARRQHRGTAQEARPHRIPARHRHAAADGRWQVQITGAQGSGILRSMSQANGLVVLHHGQGNVAAGDLVDVLPFDGLI